MARTLFQEVAVMALELGAKYLHRNKFFDPAKKIAADILGEMTEEAARLGVQVLTPEFRAPYERRIVEAWRALGMLEEV